MEDSIQEAGSVEEEEQAKARRQNRQQRLPTDNQSLARPGTNRSAASFKRPGPTDQERNPHKPFNMWAVARLRAQRPLGEWLGVTIYTFIGISANLAGVTSSNEAGTLTTLYWAWGLATMIGKFDMIESPRPAILSMLSSMTAVNKQCCEPRADLTFLSQASTSPAGVLVGSSTRW